MHRSRLIVIVRKDPNDIKEICLRNGFQEDEILVYADALIYEVYAKIIDQLILRKGHS